MTVISTFFTMDSKEGVNLNAIITSVTTTDPSYPGLPHKLGDRVQGNGGSEWLFVQASTTVTAYNVVAIDAAFKANNITSALATSNAYVYGIAEFPPSQLGTTVSLGNANGGVVNAGDQFWAALKIAAGGQVNGAVTAAVGAKLYISTVIPGNLSSSATAIQMTGIAFVGTILATISVPQSMEAVMFGYLTPYASV